MHTLELLVIVCSTSVTWKPHDDHTQKYIIHFKDLGSKQAVISHVFTTRTYLFYSLLWVVEFLELIPFIFINNMALLVQLKFSQVDYK